jgi:hypothetical protein
MPTPIDESPDQRQAGFVQPEQEQSCDGSPATVRARPANPFARLRTSPVINSDETRAPRRPTGITRGAWRVARRAGRCAYARGLVEAAG